MPVHLKICLKAQPCAFFIRFFISPIEKLRIHGSKKAILICIIFLAFLVIGCNSEPKDLRDASQKGDAVAVKRFLDEDEDPNSENLLGMTPLMLAAINGHDEVIEVLIEYGADVDAQSESGVTALTTSSGRGHTETVRVLLENGANVNLVNDRKRTALIEATIGNHAETVDLLLASGASIDGKDIIGRTALDWATKNNNEQIIFAIRNNPEKFEANIIDQNTDTVNVPTSAQPENTHLYRNVLYATGLAFLFVVALYWPEMMRLLLPFYKKGDCTKAGFLSMKSFARYSPSQGNIAYRKFIIPLFSTAYLTWLIAIESQNPNSTLDGSNDFYFMVIIWGFAMLATTSSLISSLLFVVIPFSIGYFLSNSIYGGCFATALILAIVYAYSYEEQYAYHLISNRVRERESPSRIKEFITNVRYLSLILTPIAKIIEIISNFLPTTLILFALINIIRNSEFSSEGIVLTYGFSSNSDDLLTLLISLGIFSNISIRLFSRGIFKYLQVDFFKVLGERLLFSMQEPDIFSQQEGMADSPVPTSSRSSGSPFISESDRIYQLSQMPTNGFRAAVSFYSLDIILTLATLLDFPIIPGTTSENIATLSTMIKIPLYILFIVASNRRLYIWFASKGMFGTNSVTVREEINMQREIQADLDSLLTSIIEEENRVQHHENREYIDIDQNKYLLSLAGVEESEQRIHL